VQILSIGLLVALIVFVVWDYKTGTGKIHRLIIDTLILLTVTGLSAAVFGGLSAFGSAFGYPWWVVWVGGVITFALLENRNAARVNR
jgi:hypothetical protein